MLLGTVTSCHNQDVEFDDYDYQTVSFAHQQVVRPLFLGTNIFPNEDDNNHQFQVYVTLGGIWKNSKDRKVEVKVDNDIIAGKNISKVAVNGTTDPTAELIPMPSNYYELQNTTVTIPSGDMMGSVKVKLTDAYFNDAKSTKITYVLPLRIVSAEDSILKDKDYILYAVKLHNKYDGVWLKEDKSKASVEKYPFFNIYSTTLNQVKYESENGDLLLTFDGNDNCTISSAKDGVTVEGTGKWTFEGAGKAWGDRNRDQMDLSYTVTAADGTKKSYTEKLISRDRGTDNRALYFTYSE